MHVANKTTLFNQYATIAGYPSDKPENTLWKDKSTIIKMTDKQVYYNTDTYRGQSGAPVLDDKASIYAIHTNGNSQHNWGTLLTNELFSVVANISHMTQSSED
ncbi:Extracellular metalloprotease precursor [Corynebacterium matruchotii]|nr:Extracellular metalloprotease precursor [Corynebacterium matruchotii]